MDKELPEPEKPALTVLSLSELLNYDVAPRSYLLEPWLPEQGLVMIYAARDAGKTWFALWLANAVSLGRTFIKWTAPRPRKVLYIDGEMPLSMMKERMGKIVADNQSNNDCIFFINPDT